MKILLQLLSVCVYSLSFAQDQPISLTYQDSQDASKFKEISNGTKLSKYTSLVGSELKIGDTLIIGTPAGNISSTRLSEGSLSTKTNPSFTTIRMGKPIGFENAMLAMGGESSVNAGPAMIGQIVKIVEMVVYHKGSKKKPLSVTIILGEPNGRAFGVYKYLSVIDYENSALLGEIKSKNTPMTSDEALTELKKAKDKLDLELISLDEYNVIKERLRKFIK